jgi:Glycosyl transferase family 2
VPLLGLRGQLIDIHLRRLDVYDARQDRGNADCDASAGIVPELKGVARSNGTGGGQVSDNNTTNGQGRDDWFEQPGSDGAPIRFVERRQGGRRQADARIVGEMPPAAVPVQTVSLVIPTMNEARNVGDVLDRLPAMVTEVVLVDASSDVTKLMARNSRPDIRIISEPAPGKGNALRAGLSAARGDVLVAMDADGSMSPEEIPRFVHPLAHGFDFTKGSRFMAGGGSLDITPIRRLGNKALVEAANALLGVRYTDLCYGFFAIRRLFLESLDLRSTGFEIETEIIVRAQLVGLRIAEVPSVELPRRNGVSNLRTVRDGTRVLRTLLTERRIQRAAGGQAASLFESADDQRQPVLPTAAGHRPGSGERGPRQVERIETARPTSRSTAER